MFSQNEEFLIIGYSFGSLLTLEFATILEKTGRKGSIIVADGSPQFVHKLTNFSFNGKTLGEIKAVFITYSIRLFFMDNFKEVEKKVFSFSSWDDQLKCVGKHIAEMSKLSQEYATDMLEAVLRRIKISLHVDNYPFTILTKTPISLIKSSQSSLTNIEDDYGLGQFSTNTMKTIVCEGDHASILLSREFIQIIEDIIE